jgi:putative SOS response-associated peptidase YedK
LSRLRDRARGPEELAMMRWGVLNPPQYPGITTNLRKSPHWRRWLGPQSRCLVPFTSFCEYADTKPKKTPKWFALDEARPLIAFAGLWTEWGVWWWGRFTQRPCRSSLPTPENSTHGCLPLGMKPANFSDHCLIVRSISPASRSTGGST